MLPGAFLLYIYFNQVYQVVFHSHFSKEATKELIVLAQKFVSTFDSALSD